MLLKKRKYKPKQNLTYLRYYVEVDLRETVQSPCLKISAFHDDPCFEQLIQRMENAKNCVKMLKESTQKHNRISKKQKTHKKHEFYNPQIFKISQETDDIGQVIKMMSEQNIDEDY